MSGRNHNKRRIDLDEDDLEIESLVPNTPPQLHVSCSSGKRWYRKESRAAMIASSMRFQKRDPFIEHYRCKECGQWHVGHMMGASQMRRETGITSGEKTNQPKRNI